METTSHVREGGCTCGLVRYQVRSEPMIVHCCHCRGCQKNSGSAFALNALYEADRVELKAGQIEEITVPTPSGKGQIIARCGTCKVALWSNYFMGGLNKRIRFVRVGTLDDPDQMPPDVHIYTSSKQPWIAIPHEDMQVDQFYLFSETWSAASIERLAQLEKSAGINIFR